MLVSVVHLFFSLSVSNLFIFICFESSLRAQWKNSKHIGPRAFARRAALVLCGMLFPLWTWNCIDRAFFLDIDLHVTALLFLVILVIRCYVWNKFSLGVSKWGHRYIILKYAPTCIFICLSLCAVHLGTLRIQSVLCNTAQCSAHGISHIVVFNVHFSHQVLSVLLIAMLISMASSRING